MSIAFQFVWQIGNKKQIAWNLLIHFDLYAIIESERDMIYYSQYKCFLLNFQKRFCMYLSNFQQYSSVTTLLGTYPEKNMLL